MGGAYTAKPDAAVTPPDVPPDWDPDWPEPPGGFPPGYAPVYSLVMSAVDSVLFNGDVVPTVTLRDHDTYATLEPSGPTIAWTATLGGETVNLRFSGDEDYSSSIASSYAEVGDYWGAEPTLEFELTTNDVGETLTLVASSTVAGSAISDSIELEVVEVKIFGFALKYGPTQALGAEDAEITLSVLGNGNVYNTICDSGGYWEVSVLLDDVDGKSMLLLCALDPYATQLAFPSAITETGEYRQADIEFPPIYTAQMSVNVYEEDLSGTDIGTVTGLVYNDYPAAPYVGYKWDDVAQAWTEYSGSGSWQLTTAGIHQGIVHIDKADWALLENNTITIDLSFSHAMFLIGSMNVTFRLYRESELIDTETKELTTDSTVDWLTINSDSITVL